MTETQQALVGAAEATPNVGASLKKTLLASSSARAVVLPLTGVCNLIIARLITGAVGIHQLGGIMLIATLSQLLTFSDLGAGAAVATASSQLDGAPEAEEALRRTVLTALRTMLISSLAIIAIATIISLLGDWPTLLGVHYSRHGSVFTVNVTVLLALTAFGLSVPMALGEAILRGRSRLHQAILLTGLSAPIALVLTVVLYLLHAPPLAFALTIPLGALLGTSFCLVAAVRAVRTSLAGLQSQLFHWRRFPGKRIADTAVPWFVIMIGLPIALQSDRIVISHRVAATGLSNYSYLSQLYLPLWSIISIAGLALWPIFSSGPKSGPELRRNWLVGVKYLGAAGVIAAILFVGLSGIIVGWTSAGTADLGYLLPVSFAALLLVQALHVGTGMLLISPRQLQFQAWCIVALVLTNLPLSWYLAGRVGAAGPVIASLVTVAVCQAVPGVIAALRVTR